MSVFPIIRPMQPSDLEIVFQLEKICHHFPWTKGILTDCLKVGYHGWIIEQDNVVLGFAFVSIQAGECHILNICISPTVQRQGLGLSLMQYILEFAKTQKTDIAFLEVRAS